MIFIVAGSENTMSSAEGTTRPKFHQLNCKIIGAKLKSNGAGAGWFSGGKSDHYAELIVDGEPPRRTEIIRKTLEPKWEDLFTVLVTPYSNIEFRVMVKQSVRNDVVVGTTKIDLNDLLHRQAGNLSHCILKLPIKFNDKGRESASGDIDILFEDLKISMNEFPRLNVSNSTASFENSQNWAASPVAGAAASITNTNFNPQFLKNAMTGIYC